jgi:hypothetical protein
MEEIWVRSMQGKSLREKQNASPESRTRFVGSDLPGRYYTSPLDCWAARRWSRSTIHLNFPEAESESAQRKEALRSAVFVISLL